MYRSMRWRRRPGPRILPALALCLAQAAFGAGPRVSVSGVEFEGLATATGGAAFLGIPFAAAPTGERRWAPPQPWQSEKPRRDATRFAPACQQSERMLNWYRELVASFAADPASFPAPEFSEDCLYLNIWRPAADSGERLPVIVWIHGGSNTGGWSHEPNYHGEALAAGGAVVVTIAYRLGVFGFFSLPGLAPSNFALLDQIAALEWMRDNIALFGGDPARITLAGESSGANNIAALLASPRARGLFARAVMQSGGSVLRDRAERSVAEQRGLALARALGAQSHEEALAVLRAIPAGRLLDTAGEIYAGYDFDPVVDGDTLPESPHAAIAAGRMARVPLLIGTNADEWRMYLEPPYDEAAWLGENAPGRATELSAVLGGEPDVVRRLDRLETALQFVCPSLWLAGEVQRKGQAAYVYRFTRVREGAGGERMRAYHGAEIPYLFDTHDAWLPTTAVDRRLGATLRGYWLRFAASADPNAEGGMQWPAYSPERPLALELGDEVGVAPHSELGLCAVLDQVDNRAVSKLGE